MEINETSAQRVNDVYAKLAANSAANVDEISSAMTRTASIASSAGMSFENTAAFLSQIIETTRESAETAGTALKTVIARFEELKKAPSEIGEVEGETIDANEIETALKSVGVALRDQLTGQFRDLDDVFLELSSKWDTLDKNTQRYIATIAAGSRQQSRFIAMMQDYQRTTELVSLAEESAGDSNREFQKTLESLDSKINQLTNAWNEFITGIANSDVIKAAVDTLTGLLKALNTITSTGNSTINTFLKIFAAVTIFNLLKKAVLGVGGALVAANKELKSTGNTEVGVSNAVGVLTKRLGLQKGGWISNTVALTRHRKSLNAISKTQKAVASSSASYNAALKKNGEQSDVTAAENIKLSAAIKQNNKTIADQAEVLGLNDAEKEKFILLTKSGVDANTAYKISVSELSKEELTNLGIQETDSAVQMKSNEETAKKILLDQKEAQQQEKLNSSLLGAVASKLADKTVTSDNIVLSGLHTAATKIQTVANEKLGLSITNVNVKMLTLYMTIGLVIAVIAILIISIAAVIKALNKLSLSYRLNEAYEAASALKDQVDNLKDSIEALGESESSLADLEEEFENLTEGSQDWQDKLSEINDTILDIIGEYPELAKYVTTDENGKMSISEAGWQEVTNAEEKRLAASRVALIYANQDVSKLTNQSTSDEIAGEYGLGVNKMWSLAQILAAQENSDQLLSSALGGNTEELKQIFNSTSGILGTFDDFLADYALSPDKFNNLISSIKETTKAEESIQKTLNTQIVQSDSLLSSSSYAKSLINITAGNIDYSELYAQAYKEFKTYGDYYIKSEYLKLMGESVTDANLDELADEIEQGTTTMDALRRTLASNSITKQITKEKQQEYIGFENLKNTNLNQYKLLLNATSSEEGKDLLVSQIEEIEKQLISTPLNASNLQALTNISDNTLKSIGLTGTSLFEDFINPAINLYHDALSRVEENMSDFTQYQDLTVNGINALSNSLKQITINNGSTNEFIEQLNTIQQSFDTTSDDYASFINLINTGVDVSSVESISTFVNSLDGVAQSIKDEWIDSLADITKATYITTNSIITYFNTMKDAADSLTKGTLVSSDDISTYQNLLGSSFDSYFKKITEGDETVYILTKSTEELLQGITKMQNIIAEQNHIYAKNVEIIKDDIKTQLEQNDVLSQLANDNYTGPTTETDVAAKQTYTLNLTNDAITQLKNYLNSSYFKTTGDAGLDSQGQIFNDLYYNLEASNLIPAGITPNEFFNYVSHILEQNGFVDELDSEGNFQNSLYASRDVRQAVYDALMGDEDADIGSDLIDYLTKQSEEQNALDTINYKNYTASLNNIKEWLKKVGKNTEGLSNEDIIDQWKSLYQQYLGATNDSIYNLASTSISYIIKNVGDYGADAESDLAAYLQGEYSLTQDAIDYYASLLKDNVNDASDFIATLFAASIAKNDTIIKSSLESLEDAYENWNSEDATISAQGGSQLKTALAQILNISANDITDEWMNSNRAAIKAAISSPEGLAKIQKDFASKIIEAYNADETISGIATKISDAMGDAAQDSVQTFSVATNLTVEQIDDLTEIMAYLGYSISYVNGKIVALKDSTDLTNTSYKESISDLVDLYKEFDSLQELIDAQTELENERNSLESKYNTLLSSQVGDLKALIDLQGSLITNYEKRYKIDKALYEQSSAAMVAEAEQADYYGTFWKYDEYGTAQTTDEFNKNKELLGTDIVEAVEEEVSEANELSSTTLEYLSDVEDDAENLASAYSSAQSSYIDLQNEILNAIVDIRQAEIDKLSTLNDTIKSTNSDLITSVKNNLSKIRQEISNSKTEQDLQDKRNRLAYLRLDTSGANASEIAQLEEELSDSENDYIDDLIDQKLDDLSTQNDEAADQRTKQINLLQSQLDYDKENGELWGEVNEILTAAIGGDTTPLFELYEDAKQYTGKTQQEIDKSRNETLEKISSAALYSNENQWKTLFTGINSYLSAINVDIDTLVDKYDSTSAKDAAIASIVKQATETYGENAAKEIEKMLNTRYDYATTVEGKNTGEAIVGLQSWYDSYAWMLDSFGSNAVVGMVKLSDEYNQIMSANEDNVDEINNAINTWAEAGRTYDEIIGLLWQEFPHYITGGLSTTTGPAWLDGTSSNPELVLNAQDTRNFLALKDVLSDVLRTGSQITESSGDNYYDVNINVDSISSDYDIEQMAEKVKGIIVNDAQYRNVYSINTLH